jgi:uncharacterized protein YdhG (YjbR/CyaY superfamily)
MKKKRAGGGSTGKSHGTPKDFAGYLKSTDKRARSALTKLREVLQSAVPAEASETISYRIPAFRYRNRVLLWFAAFSDHCSLFPTASVIEQFREELADYSKSKGTIHFPLDKPLPISLLRKIVKVRVKQLDKHKAAATRANGMPSRRAN